MRRGYDPSYGSREQLKDSAERNMAIARERDTLKAENAELTQQLEKWKAIADNFYDEIKIRCLEHVARHDNGSHDCVLDYEDAVGMEREV
jgi:hypothetical protein